MVSNIGMQMEWVEPTSTASLRESCEYHHNRNDKVQYSDSMNSETNPSRDADSKAQGEKQEAVTPRKVQTEDQKDLSKEAPDEQDYHL